MTTGTTLIQEALGKIGAHSVASAASAESIETGRITLNSMCEGWLSKSIKFGFTPLDVSGDDLNEPADIRDEITSLLAVRLAPFFDNGTQIVSPTLKANASKGMTEISRLYKSIDIPDKGVSSTLPLGQGNKRFRGRKRTFFGEDATING